MTHPHLMSGALALVCFALMAETAAQTQAGPSIDGVPGPVAVVLSSELQPYRQTYEAFVEAHGTTPPTQWLNDDTGRVQVPEQTRVVVAIGSKAALASYPPRVTIVECMAPAAPAHNRGRRRVAVHLLPPAEELLGFIGAVQPSLSRLAIPTVLPLSDGYLRDLQVAAQISGIELISLAIPDAQHVPDRLREMLMDQVEALWLPPDPLLINATTFRLLCQFSESNDIPLYVPTPGLVGGGATGSIAPSYAQIGASVAATVATLLAGRKPPTHVYPSGGIRTCNRSAALAAGLSLPADMGGGACDVMVGEESR